MFLMSVQIASHASSLDTYSWFWWSQYVSGGNFAQRYSGQDNNSKDYLRNVCGPMALLAIHNYYNMRNYRQIDSFSTSRQGVYDALTRVYLSVGKTPYEYSTADDLKLIALNRWGWSVAKIRSSTVFGNLVENSYQQLMSDVNAGHPAITLMEGMSTFEPADANGNRIGVEHFIAIIYADTNFIGYFDPWDGQMKWTDAQTFRNGWVKTFISVVVYP